MRIVFLAFVTSAVVCLTGINAASAKDYPYCIQGDDFAGGVGECIFSTHAQCQAAASGRTASCVENRSFSANAQIIDKGRSRHRLH
jgi:Protein of unknown function (DUF3551)